MLPLALLLAAPPAVDPAAATVNGEPVRLAEVDAELLRRPAADPLSPADKRDLRRAVTDELIDDLLVRQFLTKHGPPVEPAEVEQHLKALEQAQRKAGRTLADYYRETGQTEAKARAAWVALLQFRKMLDKQMTDAELRKYHAAYRDQFDGVRVRVSHVLARVPAGAPQGEWEQAKKNLAGLKDELAAGKVTFTGAAAGHSDCPSAARGGDIGFIRRKDPLVDEPFARAAFGLKLGEVSDPVVSEVGVHLIRVTERKAGTPTPFEAVREAVADAYADDVRAGLLAKLRKEATIVVTLPER
jgi:parvulin-like peptidyl-prolyl isomerase